MRQIFCDAGYLQNNVGPCQTLPQCLFLQPITSQHGSLCLNQNCINYINKICAHKDQSKGVYNTVNLPLQCDYIIIQAQLAWYFHELQGGGGVNTIMNITTAVSSSIDLTPKGDENRAKNIKVQRAATLLKSGQLTRYMNLICMPSG